MGVWTRVVARGRRLAAARGSKESDTRRVSWSLRVILYVVMEILGHSQVGLTITTYAYVLTMAQREPTNLPESSLARVAVRRPVRGLRLPRRAADRRHAGGIRDRAVQLGAARLPVAGARKGTGFARRFPARLGGRAGDLSRRAHQHQLAATARPGGPRSHLGEVPEQGLRAVPQPSRLLPRRRSLPRRRGRCPAGARRAKVP